MADRELDDLALRVGHALKASRRMLATAESCTGGWVAQAVTAVPGSSHWFERGFVTYTNEAKQEMLGVSGETLAAHGAVSEAVVREMAQGALAHSRAQAALAISGVAGPSGGTPAKPVGMVCLAWAVAGSDAQSETQHYPGDREAVRRAAVVRALVRLLQVLEKNA